MKLNIGPPVDGYVSVPFGNPLAGHCSPGEADEVLALGAIEYVPPADVGSTLDEWCSLVGAGGRLTVGSVDPLEVAALTTAGAISEDGLRDLLHGTDRPKASNYSAARLAAELTARGLTVVLAKLDGVHAVVTGERGSPVAGEG